MTLQRWKCTGKNDDGSACDQYVERDPGSGVVRGSNYAAETVRRSDDAAERARIVVPPVEGNFFVLVCPRGHWGEYKESDAT